MRPNRDLNRAIRVIFGLIRELGMRRLLLSRPALGVAGATPENRTAEFFPKSAAAHVRSAACAAVAVSSREKKVMAPAVVGI